MANADDTYALVVDMGESARNIDAVQKELDELVDTAVRATTAQRAIGRALEEGMDRAAERSRKTGQAMLELSRGFQDFAQGGVGGVLNNLEGLTRAFETLRSTGVRALLSGPEGIAGAITLVGTAAYVAAPHIKKMWDELTGPAKVAVPRVTDSVEALTAAFNAQKKAIADLRAQGSLYAYQVDELARREAELKDAEVQLKAAVAARSVPEFSGKAWKERAAAFREAVEEYGGSQKVLEAMKQAGVEARKAEGILAGALIGGELSIQKVQELLRKGAGALGYRSPLERERAERRRQATEDRLAENAEEVKGEQQRRERRARDRAERLREQTDAILAENAARIARQEKDREAGEERFGPAFDAAGAANVARLRAQMQQEQALFGRALPFGEEDEAARAAAARRARALRPRPRLEGGEAATGTELGVGGGVGAAAMRAPQLQKELAEAEAQGLQAILATLVPLAGQVDMWRRVAAQAQQTARDMNGG